MASTLARSNGVTTSPNPEGLRGGVGTGPLPRDGQLSLGERIADEYSEEARLFREAVRTALLATGKSLNEIAEELRMDGSLLTRQLQGNGANLDPRVIVYALWRDPTHDLGRYTADLSSGEWKPKPRPGWEVWGPALMEELARADLWSHYAPRIGYRPPTEDAP